MDKKYLISIKGLQSYGDDDTTDVSLTTEADFEHRDGVYFIDYEESELTGLEGTKTSIEIGSNYVSLTRNGSVNTQMLFMKDRKTNTYYNTPYGDLLIGIFTDKMNIDVDKTGGKINVDYYLDVNSQTSSKNNFEIEIKRQNA
ncbi:MAG: DUF1934 domain-containing protein [Clostridia bacterium]|nr:DUF1934 domain-containing protein [Clostridia bacterium]